VSVCKELTRAHPQLYDAYIRFFCWATDRLQGHDGIVCFVSNNAFETADEYELTEVNDGSLPYDESQRVEKMRLTPDKTAVIVNKALTLTGIPQACFAYRLGNRCALEWVIDQYQVTTDKRSGIVSDPKRPDDPEYIVRLLKQVVMVSVKTVQLIGELEQAVTLHD